MTRLVVLSDTHMPRRGRELPDRVLQELPDADLIVHLGDFTRIEIADFLRTFGPLAGVHGNNDGDEVRQQFPQQQRLQVDGYTLALLHGHLGGRTALAAARTVRDADVVLFGHSHRPWNASEGGTLLFNPGSPTDRRWFPYPSFGIIDLEPGRLEGTIIPLVEGPDE